MVEANARTLRPLVKPALKAAALEHGWRRAMGGAFTADPSVVTPPIVTRLAAAHPEYGPLQRS